jgi:hypothetical protein
VSTVQYPVSWLIGRTRSLLLGTTRTQLNQVASQVQTGDTLINVVYNVAQSGPNVIDGGDIVSIDDELLYVISSSGSSSGSTITCLRGFNGTTPVPHAASALIWINPYYSQFDIRNALMDEIRSWGPQVFAVFSLDLNTTDFVDGYDLGALGSWYNVLDVTIEPDPLVSTPDDKSWPRLDFDVRHMANTTDFPSGNALIITQSGGIYDSPRSIHVVYAAPFNVDSTNGAGNATFQDADDLIATVGLDPSSLDIPALGAAWRLILRAELRRDLTQAMGDSADLTNHPATAAMQVATNLKKMRDDRLKDAELRLRAQFPYIRTA